MKTWEMIKELSENPEKKFRIKNSKNIIGFNKSTHQLEWLDLESHVPFVVHDTALDEEWEEVKEPVSFLEAVRSGKRIMVKHNIIINYRPLGALMNILCGYDDDKIREFIDEGKWYIE